MHLVGRCRQWRRLGALEQSEVSGDLESALKFAGEPAAMET
ncbi:MAG TPA: hypothetical protein VLD62_12285 [Acidimicrobiia bacterium]|nr:hypothetical protein [Acidimicrobiia bacterium]